MMSSRKHEKIVLGSKKTEVFLYASWNLEKQSFDQNKKGKNLAKRADHFFDVFKIFWALRQCFFFRLMKKCRHEKKIGFYSHAFAWSWSTHSTWAAQYLWKRASQMKSKLSSKSVFRYQLYQPRWAIWFCSKNADSKMKQFLWILAKFSINFVAFSASKEGALSRADIIRI